MSGKLDFEDFKKLWSDLASCKVNKKFSAVLWAFMSHLYRFIRQIMWVATSRISAKAVCAVSLWGYLSCHALLFTHCQPLWGQVYLIYFCFCFCVILFALCLCSHLLLMVLHPLLSIYGPLSVMEEDHKDHKEKRKNLNSI